MPILCRVSVCSFSLLSFSFSFSFCPFWVLFRSSARVLHLLHRTDGYKIIGFHNPASAARLLLLRKVAGRNKQHHIVPNSRTTKKKSDNTQREIDLERVCVIKQLVVIARATTVYGVDGREAERAAIAASLVTAGVDLPPDSELLDSHALSALQTRNGREREKMATRKIRRHRKQSGRADGNNRATEQELTRLVWGGEICSSDYYISDRIGSRSFRRWPLSQHSRQQSTHATHSTHPAVCDRRDE